MSGKTKDQLAAELAAANTELATLRATSGDVATALSQYKAKVKKVALEAKMKYDWCEVVDDLLRELDIDPTPPRFRFTAMIPVTIEATVVRKLRNYMTNEEVANWIRNSFNISVIENALLEIGQRHTEDTDALLDTDWDTYADGYDSKNSWSLKVGDNITVQDVEQVTE